MYTTTTIDPASGAPLEEHVLHSPEYVNEALSRAHDTFETWRRTPMADRAALLRRIARILRDDVNRFAMHATREMGKPIAQARAEVAKCARACDFFAENAPRFLADEPAASDAAESYVVFEPLGPLLAIMPWNFPYWQVFRAAAPAIMAGNPIVLKHALSVTRCSLEIEDIFRRAGAPRGLFQSLVVPHDAMASIVHDERIVAATLTGSERAGASIAREAGGVIKKTVLELGGSDAFIVLADADIEAAAEKAVASRFQNCGQSCIAAKRFIVEAPVAGIFTQRFIIRTRALVIGDPMDEATDLGPLARADLRDEVARQVRETLEAGARVLLGDRTVERPGYYYEPTVLADVPEHSPVFTEEVFGPVAPVVVARDAEDAIARANASRFGLGNNLWTRDIPRAKRLARELTSGSVFVNGMTASDPRLPFGGVKRSGFGRELAAFGIREFVNVKTVWIGPPAAGGMRDTVVE